MVLPSLFTKSSKKSKSSAPPVPHLAPHSPASSNPGTPPSSPDKSTHSRVKERERTHTSSRRSNSNSYSSRRSSKYDDDSHPLNFPPEQRKRFSHSAMSAMADQPAPVDVPMVDRDASSSPAPSSPAAANPPKANGVNGHDESRPAPPPHRYTKSPPPQGTNYAATPEAATPPPEPPTIDAEEYKAAGNKFFKIKDYPAAIKEYSKEAAIEADPKNATYYSNRAAAFISANRFYEALEDCKMADELDPDNMKILLRLGRVYTSLGRPDEAVQVYNQINATAKDMQPALNMQKHLRMAEETSKNEGSGSMVVYALNEAEKGLGVGVDRPRKWLLMRGEAHLRMGNPNALGEAQNVVMAILRNNNQDPDALVLRGRILYAQGENDKAMQHFRQALSCDPDFKAAVKYLRMVQKLERMKSDGNASFKAGRYQQAVDTYTEALEVDPSNKNTNSKILQNRALCNSRLKNWKAATADCDRALELDPSYTKARKTRAKALGESGNWDEAIRELKAIHEANPAEPGIAKEIRDAELELKKSKRKDYYKILGLEKDCTEQEIKKAYRKLAIIHHPDKNPGDEEAAERFKEIQEAHETLSDSQKRARYDSGEDLIDPSDMFGGGGGMGGAGGIDPEILMQMFGGMGGGGMGGMGGGRGGGGGFHFSTGGGSPFGGMGGMPGGQRRGGPPGGFPF
ncbi:TPR-like protein [Setomelanomma holmii]|uniref:TPR-like protein n=1 Tax=Setomelanomma holmii TaxID=210430 RepID=A0A9P4LM82_9PLEO|nr:TPR-like protein [Setomelanomma holmii]